MRKVTFGHPVGRAALIVSVGVLLSRVLGQLREVIFAALLGADGITDQYVAAFRIPDFLNYLLAGGFLSVTFIPIFARHLAADDEEGGWQALAALTRPIAIGISVLVGVGLVLAPVVVEALYPSFTEAQLAGTVRLTRIVLPAQIFFVLGALFSAAQYAKGMFIIPTLAPVVYNCCIIGGGLAFQAITGIPDPEGFIWGAVVGAFIGNFFLQLWGARRAGMQMKLFGGPWRHPAQREYLTIALPLMLGQSIVVLDETFMSTFGAIVGEGAQTHLLYARRTMFVPVGVIAQAAGVAAYPFLARLFAENRTSELADTVDRTLRWVLSLSILMAGAMIALATPVIRVLFERGAFQPADTKATSGALLLYAFAIPVWGGLQILTRAFYARRQMWTAVVVGTSSTILAIPIYWFMQHRFGLEGVASASVMALGLYTTMLAVLWYRESNHRGRIRSVVETAGRSLPPAAGGALASAALINVFPDNAGAIGSVGTVLAGLMVYVVAACAIAVGLHTLFRRPRQGHRTSHLGG